MMVDRNVEKASDYIFGLANEPALLFACEVEFVEQARRTTGRQRFCCCHTVSPR